MIVLTRTITRRPFSMRAMSSNEILSIRRCIYSPSISVLHMSTTSDEKMNPKDLPQIHLKIEYCTGCKWGLRSFWMAHEMLLRAQQQQQHKQQQSHFTLDAVSLIPNRSRPGGVFRIDVDVLHPFNKQQIPIWDRVVDGGFPEICDLQQRLETTAQQLVSDHDSVISTTTNTPAQDLSPQVSILYDSSMPLVTRAIYTGTEIMLSTFTSDLIKSFTIRPMSMSTTDTTTTPHDRLYRIAVDNETILWQSTTSTEDGTLSFPDVVQLKRQLRDILDPTKELGHLDDKQSTGSRREWIQSNKNADDSEDARRFFGVL
jgi:selenoprotein W-related protein